jgi:hypothetical protein
MPHEDLALPYVLGALSPVEREALSRARLYDRSLEQTIASFERHMAAHWHPGPKAAPPTALWRKIASALSEERAALAGKRVEAFPDGQWQAIATGIEAKQMGGQYVWLLRCDLGPIVRPRAPATDEHLLVVAGDLFVGGRSFSTGDYLFSQVDDLREDLRSTGGCILLVLRTASQNIRTPLHPLDGRDP